MTISKSTGISYLPDNISSVAVGNIAASGVIGASSLVDNYDMAILGQTTATVLLSNPAPTNTSIVRVFRWYNGGTVPVWSAYGQYIGVGGFADQMYIPGTGWKGVGTQSPQTILVTTTPVAFPLDTNENNITLLTVPAGFPAAGSTFDVAFDVDNTSGTSNKTVKCKFGTFDFYSATALLAGSSANMCVDKRIYLPTTASQIGPHTSIASNGGALTTLTTATGTADTASNTAIRVSVQKVTGSDVTTFRFARIMYTHGA